MFDFLIPKANAQIVPQSLDPLTAGWGELVQVVQNIINLAFTVIIPIIAAIMVVYAGFKFVTAGGNDSKIKSAKEIIKSAVIGVFIAYGAGLLIKIIIGALGITGTTNPIQ